MIRFLSNCVLLISIFLLPPYATFILVIFGIFIFDAYIESILWAYLLDILYGGGGFLGIHTRYLFSIAAVLIFLFSFEVKKILTFYPAV